jgi:hypothetical protein
VSPEGVVLGADSTASYGDGKGGLHYFNHTQKVFQLGESGTLGVAIWGLGGLGPVSYRTLFALLSDSLDATPAQSVEEVMQRWVDLFSYAYWSAYGSLPDLKSQIDECKALAPKPPYLEGAQPAPDARTKEEEEKFQRYRQTLGAGFCIGGYVLPNRTPAAWSVWCDPSSNGVPVLNPVNLWGFWGAPNMIQRLIFGLDGATKESILGSGKWKGTLKDLDGTIAKHGLAHPIIPIRDAIDFVFSCIFSTIKALKFSMLQQTCGGPIELAVITTDRRFRWVRHKEWDAAVLEGQAR